MTTPSAARQRRWLVTAMSLAFVTLLLTITVKWQQFGYTGLDLAIYTQAMDNTRLGHPMAVTIHPHSYFGDHVELILIALLPFYALIPSPLTLLVLQALALVSAAVPVWLLARRRFPNGPIPLLAALAYLLQPFVLNTALFEFHALALAIPLIFWTLLAYEEKRWRWFLVGLVGTLLVREDTALISVGFGLLALIDRRSLRWIVTPIALGAIWLKSMMTVTGYFNQEGTYKFVKLYGWLGDSLPAILNTVVLRPWVWLQRVFGLTSLVSLLGLLLPFAYLPVLAPRVLLTAALAFLQLLLLGLGENGLRIHYTALLLPFLFVASLDALARIAHATHGRVLPLLRREWQLGTLVLGTIVIASSIVVGPYGAAALERWQGERSVSAEDRVGWSLLATLDRPVRGVFSFRPITPLARSPDVYSAHYIFLGHRQYTTKPYPVSDRVTLMLLDDRDLLTFQLLYKGDDDVGYGRLAAFLKERRFALAQQIGHLLLYDASGTDPRPVISELTNVRLNDALTLTALEPVALTRETIGADEYSVATFGLRWRAEKTMEENFQLRVTLQDDRGEIQQELFALNPLEPTRTWQPGTDHAWTYRPVLNRTPIGSLQTRVEVISVKGVGGLNGLRSIVPRYRSIRPIGSPIVIPTAAGRFTR